MKRIILSMIAGACLLASATAAPSEAEMDSLLRKTLTGVAKIIAEEFGKIGIPAVKAEQMQQQAKFSYLGEEEFNKRKIHGETTWKYMYYDGNEPASVKVNKTALAALMDRPSRDAAVEESARILVEEAAQIIGEARAYTIYDGIRSYWYYGHKRNQPHIHDNQMRTNPEALLGLYARHVVDRRCLSREQNFHSYLRQKAAIEPAYSNYVNDIVAHYPTEAAGIADNKGLFAMLRYENQRIQIWMLAGKAIYRANSMGKGNETVKELVNITNHHIRTTLAQSPLPQSQKDYIDRKYAIDKTLTAMLRSINPSDNIDDRLVKELGFDGTRNISKVSPEEERKAIFAKVRDAYLQYYALQDTSKVWKENDGIQHEELETLLDYVLPQSVAIMHTWMTQYCELAKQIVDKSSADKYAESIHLYQDMMGQLSANIVTVMMMYAEESTCLKHNKSMRNQMAQIYSLYNEADKIITQGYDNPMFFNSEKLKSIYLNISKKDEFALFIMKCISISENRS